jgi:pimeloyl-ACP methyl ester carboxylesterase
MHIGILRVAAAALLTGLVAHSSLAADVPPAGRMYEVNGARLYVEITGSGPPLLLLHGGLSFYDRTFPNQRQYFSTFRTVIGIDQRGHGHSPDTDKPLTYELMAEDTAAIMQRLHLGRTDIVGHSDGGNVGLLLARFHPDLVRRLVISGSNYRGDFAGLKAYVWLRWFTTTERWGATWPANIRPYYVRVSPDGPAHWPVMLDKTRQLWATWTVIRPADLNAIQIPVLVMAGDHDAVTLEHTISLYRYLPHARLSILPNTGHDTMVERPEDFNRLTREFLETPSP